MAYREFRDSNGRRWEAWDVYPTGSISGHAPGVLLNEDTAEGWLAFQSGREKRRFYRHPDDWQSMTDAELAVLLKHAVQVQ